ncbi:hypothetical protein EXIGLDRAFT_566759, partial [Exidia glandulosa HHB12029]
PEVTILNSRGDFPDVPPPWHMEGECWWMLLKPLQTVPPAAYDPLEEPPEDDDEPTNTFVGGFGAVWITRYASSPIGPYDELLYLPGNFAAPSGDPKPRVTRTYVSTPEAVYTGSCNWNIPKHLARFKFTEQGDGSTLIEVFDYTDVHGPPFFAAVATPQRFAPSFPFPSNWLKLASFTQPPLPKGDDRRGEVGTEDWCAV